MTGAVAVVCAALAGFLVLRPVATPVRPQERGRSWRLTPWSVGGLAAASAALVLVLDGAALVLGAIVLGCGAAVARMLVRAGRLRAGTVTRQRVVEAGEALAGELRAGQPPVTALEHGAEVWPALAPVAAAGRLGADVPEAMTRLAARPGAEQMRALASAWRVSERSGAALTTALTQVVETARADLATSRLVRAELASAQATARLVAVLPLLTVTMAAGTGADPWAFLTRHPVGLGCLAGGVALVFVGLWWIDRIAEAVLR